MRIPAAIWHSAPLGVCFLVSGLMGCGRDSATAENSWLAEAEATVYPLGWLGGRAHEFLARHLFTISRQRQRTERGECVHLFPR